MSDLLSLEANAPTEFLQVFLLAAFFGFFPLLVEGEISLVKAALAGGKLLSS